MGNIACVKNQVSLTPAIVPELTVCCSGLICSVGCTTMFSSSKESGFLGFMIKITFTRNDRRISYPKIF